MSSEVSFPECDLPSDWASDHAIAQRSAQLERYREKHGEYPIVVPPTIVFHRADGVVAAVIQPPAITDKPDQILHEILVTSLAWDTYAITTVFDGLAKAVTVEVPDDEVEGLSDGELVSELTNRARDAHPDGVGNLVDEYLGDGPTDVFPVVTVATISNSGWVRASVRRVELTPDGDTEYPALSNDEYPLDPDDLRNGVLGQVPSDVFRALTIVPHEPPPWEGDELVEQAVGFLIGRGCTVSFRFPSNPECLYTREPED